MRELGLQVDVRSPEDAGDPKDYDAVIIGSAVYDGKWLDSALEFVRKHREVLMDRAVWLFSSGPTGEPYRPEEDPIRIEQVEHLTLAREHRLFGGKLDLHALRLSERSVVLAMHTPQGDFRDWDAIDAWADGIAGELQRGVINVDGWGRT
ncbi:hypothetical protein GCM10027569_83250 [Flindersiella endophytica]